MSIDPTGVDRRQFIYGLGASLGALAFSNLLGCESASSVGNRLESPLAPKVPMNLPKAKAVIFLSMEGGPSHIDLFDPKPKLNELAGQPLPSSFKPVITPMGVSDAPLLASQRKWKQHGQCGTWVSDWLPEIATCVDDITVIRSCY